MFALILDCVGSASYVCEWALTDLWPNQLILNVR